METQIEPGRVDVTNGDAQVTVRVHATDDTGVTGVQVLVLHHQDDSVQLGGPALLPVSGGERDGWWEETFTIARYTKPATLRPRVYVIDRLERMTTDETSPTTLQVDDANPDTELPRMSLTTLDPASVDVRSQARDVDGGRARHRPALRGGPRGPVPEPAGHAAVHRRGLPGRRTEGLGDHPRRRRSAVLASPRARPTASTT